MHDMREMQLRYNPNIHNVMEWHTRYTRWYTTEHTQCYGWNGIRNAIWAYTNMREPQPHSHKRPSDENKTPRNACTRARKPRTDPQAPKCHSNETWQGHGIWYAIMQKSVARWGAKQPRNPVKRNPMHEIIPKCEIRHPKWLVAIQYMHNLNMT